MLHVIHGIIRSRVELLVLLKSDAPDLLDLFAYSRLWSCRFADRSNWSMNDMLDGMKITFLYDLKIDCLSEHDLQILGIHGEITSMHFDRYWELERVLDTNSVEDVIKKGADREDFPAANHFLNAKVDYFREHKHMPYDR